MSYTLNEPAADLSALIGHLPSEALPTLYCNFTINNGITLRYPGEQHPDYCNEMNFQSAK